MSNIRALNARGGYITIAVIVFAGVFGMIIAGLSGFIFVQSRLERAKEHRESAVQIAEAGLDYYRWFLSHFPEDLTDGTGAPGPYVHDYDDPEEGTIGTFSLNVDGNVQCDVLQSVQIESTGATIERPELERTVLGKYARPSVAEYAYIIGRNVWVGADHVITGRYHGNGGIRMDGTNDSTVTSAVSTWLCTSSFGCSPSQNKAGVFGAGSGSALWEFPVPQIDFAGLTVDLVNMKTQAEDFGVYIAPSGAQGYRVVFLANGSFNLYRVTGTSAAQSIHIDDIGGGWKLDYHTITSQTLVGNYVLPESCKLAFVEDKVWVEGTVSGKISLVAADVTNPNVDPDLIIQGNILYNGPIGQGQVDGLTAIGEHSVLIPLVAPVNLTVNGILIAQKGYFGRNLYPCWYAPNDKRTTLSINGTIVSFDRVGTKWGYYASGCGSNWSGYSNRTTSYDRQLATDPPPLTPYVSDEFEFVEWRESE